MKVLSITFWVILARGRKFCLQWIELGRFLKLIFRKANLVASVSCSSLTGWLCLLFLMLVVSMVWHRHSKCPICFIQIIRKKKKGIKSLLAPSIIHISLEEAGSQSHCNPPEKLKTFLEYSVWKQGDLY